MREKPEDAELSALFDGSYELLRVIGRGANSIVYQARSLRITEDIPQFVALKILTSKIKGGPENVARVEREEYALRASRHENVIRCYNHQARPELCYLALELAERGDLRRLTERREMAVAQEVSLALISQILAGLESIHRSGIIHRDIKPENVLLTKDGVAKISDFGIALLPAEKHQRRESSNGAGTFDYLAPEFLEGGSVTPLTDIYSVGITSYQLLTRSFPFEGTTLTERIQRKMKGQRIPLQSYLRRDLPELQEILDKALAPDPRDRFQSAAQFREALQLYLFEIGGTRGRPIKVVVSAGESSKPVDPSDGWVTPKSEIVKVAEPQKQVAKKKFSLFKRRPKPKARPSVSEVPAAQRIVLNSDSAWEEMKREERIDQARVSAAREMTATAFKGAALFLLLFFIGLRYEAFTAFFQQARQTAQAAVTDDPSNPADKNKTWWQKVSSRVEPIVKNIRGGIRTPIRARTSPLEPLTRGAYVGVLHKLEGRKKGVSLSIRGLGKDLFEVTVGLPSWKPQVIALSAVGADGSFTVTNGQKRLQFRIGNLTEKLNEVNRGTYLDVNRNSTGTLLLWRASGSGAKASDRADALTASARSSIPRNS